MNLKKLIVFLVLSLFCIPTGFVFADGLKNDLEIDQGKNLLFELRNIRYDTTWYTTENIYDNVNIGAGTKVVLDSQWEYVYKGSHVETSEYDPESEEPQDITETRYEDYAKEDSDFILVDVMNDKEYNLVASADYIMNKFAIDKTNSLITI
ncbi:MAG: hypothetical protein II090_04210, partial [Elusimicrobia bacterium]|nr:hypothetical protein [Elusimicrobiota bacterium]